MDRLIVFIACFSRVNEVVVQTLEADPLIARVLTNRMGMGIRYDNTHTNNTVLLVIFDTVHTVSIRWRTRWPGLVTQCHSGTGRHAWPHPSRIPNAIPNSRCFASSYLLATNISSKLLSEWLSGVSMERSDSCALGPAGLVPTFHSARCRS
jgi:hypothetical protein